MRAGIKCLKCGKMISHDAYDLYSTHDGIKPPEHTISVPCPHCQDVIECAAKTRHRTGLESTEELNWSERYVLAWALNLLDTKLKDSMTGEGDEVLADFRAKIRGVKTKLNLN
jgi:phage FluMu protein Com